LDGRAIAGIIFRNYLCDQK